VGGFWDHDLHTRGLAFAPAFFDARFYQRPDWFYRPRYALGADFLLGSLFVHLGTNRYYFGDYYDAGYRRRGYAPWVDYRVRGDVFDPLLSYYRWQNRGDVRWEKDLRATYVARRDNKAARPPQTLAQQDGAKSPDAVRVVTPIDKVKTKDIKLEPVPKADIEQIRKNADDWRNFSKQRSKVESNIKPAPPPKKDAAPPPVMIDLPKPTIKPPEMKKPPPPPDVPKVQQPKGPPPDKKKGKGKDKDNDVSFGGGRIPILPISTARLESCRHENTRILVQWKGAYRYGNGQEKLSGASAG
jgi:hypothetical protein